MKIFYIILWHEDVKLYQFFFFNLVHWAAQRPVGRGPVVQQRDVWTQCERYHREWSSDKHENTSKSRCSWLSLCVAVSLHSKASWCVWGQNSTLIHTCSCCFHQEPPPQTLSALTAAVEHFQMEHFTPVSHTHSKWSFRDTCATSVHVP